MLPKHHNAHSAAKLTTFQLSHVHKKTALIRKRQNFIEIREEKVFSPFLKGPISGQTFAGRESISRDETEGDEA